MSKKFLQLNDLGAYKESFKLSNYIWKLIISWNYFAKKTVGNQFVRSIDSISANVAEGFGRRTKRDKVKFYYYAYGSICESLDWNEKSKVRNLVSPEDHDFIITKLQELKKEINSLIKFTMERMKS